MNRDKLQSKRLGRTTAMLVSVIETAVAGQDCAVWVGNMGHLENTYAALRWLLTEGEVDIKSATRQEVKLVGGGEIRFLLHPSADSRYRDSSERLRGRKWKEFTDHYTYELVGQRTIRREMYDSEKHPDHPNVTTEWEWIYPFLVRPASGVKDE